MNATHQAAATLLAFFAAGAGAADVPPLEDYEAFAEILGPQSMLNPAVPDSRANDLVARGLASGDPQIVELTVVAMGRHASLTARGGDLAARNSLSRLPGLREFLVGYWHAHRADRAGGSVTCP